MPLELRRLLAHHIHDGASTETYSRDVLAPAARELEEILTAIQSGELLPDATCSQTRAHATTLLELPAQPQDAGDGQEVPIGELLAQEPAGGPLDSRLSR
ncbi:unnamed protein product [Symbiodinium natans]|uniref:Uncharacterized protein n=1 Tax=Symbiodinium natans TaxID=878477 RepID=A0A812I123_9DINO|nr:unnamed protein product [Symbiodinium natans]